MQNARNVLAVLLVAVIAALTPASALSKTTKQKKIATNNAIVLACENNGYQLTGTYSLSALKAAYNAIPVAAREYTSCAQVITNKINQVIADKKIKGGDSSKSSGSGFPVVTVIIIVIVVIGAGGAFYSYRRARPDQGE